MLGHKQTKVNAAQFGWNAHDAIQGWTASVDVKASVALVLETAVAGAAAHALISSRGELHSAYGFQLANAITAVAALVSAVGCALWVIYPRLGRRTGQSSARRGLIFFGDLRKYSSSDVARHLSCLTDSAVHQELAQQLVVTASIAWRKHVWLQSSLLLFASGAILFLLSLTAY